MENSVLDPAIAALLPKLPLRDAENATPSRIREELRALAASRADVPPPMVSSVHDETIDGSGRPIGIRIYKPAKALGSTLIFFHGGGWVAGDLETHDRVVRLIANEVGAVVVAVDYRRPPEATFPAAYDDAMAAVQNVFARIDDFGGDAARLGVAGDSAGGNIAAAVAIACRDANMPIKAQFLIYPATDATGLYRDPVVNGRYPSRAENAEGYFLSLAITQWFAGQYLAGEPSRALDWRASPVLATDLSGVPPTVLCTAQFDPLRDEGDAYAKALADAGVELRHHRGKALIHGYFGMVGASAAAKVEVERCCADVKELLR